MQTRHDCAVRGRKVTEDECASAVFNATAEQLAKCKACPRGQAIAATAPNWREAAPLAHTPPAPPLFQEQAQEHPGQAQDIHEQESAAQAQAEQPPQAPAAPRSAWDMVSQATGCTTHARLAKQLRCSQPPVSAAFRKLAKGKVPPGQIFQSILKFSGFTTLELLQPANMTQAVYCALGAPEEQADTPPTTTSEPQTEPVIIHGDKLPLTMMGADPDEQLLTTSEAEQLLAAPSAIPEGWEVYTPSYERRMAPSITICQDGDANLNGQAVREYGLDRHSHVQLLWHRATSSLGLRPVSEPGPGVVKIQLSKAKASATVCTGGLLRRYGLSPVRSKAFDLTPGPGGLLVAKLDMMPAQGEEAA